MGRSPLTSAHTLRDESPKITWKGPKRELSRQYSSIPLDNHATQAFECLQQGPHELLEMYLCRASEPLLKSYHTLDMSQISVLGLNHYTVVYGLGCRELKGCLAGHWSTH